MKNTMKKWLALLLAAVMMLSLVACAATADSEPAQSDEPQQSETAETPQEEVEPQPEEDEQPAEPEEVKLVSEGFVTLDYADKFSIERFEGGYRMISIFYGEETSRFLTIPEGAKIPADVDDDVCVLQLPITSVYSSSTAVTSICQAMGAMDAIKFVHTENWHIEEIAAMMEAGTVQYAGAAKAPDYELLSDGGVQLYMCSLAPNEDVGAKFAELGVPCMGETTSLESHPLGRVEWAKVFGVLFDAEDEADAYFESQKALMDSVLADEPLGKTVAIGYGYDGTFYARNGGDYFVKMIDMVGGTYVCADLEPEKSGNTKVSFEEWYAMVKEADYLFYLNWGDNFYSIDEMLAYNPLFGDFKAVQSGNVWISSPDFAQAVSDIASIAADMGTILAAEDPSTITTDHLIKLPQTAETAE